MNDIDVSEKAEAVPTSYLFSFIYYALAVVIATAASVLTIAGGIYAVWRLYISNTLRHFSINGMNIVLVSSLFYYTTGFLSAVIHYDDSNSVSQIFTRLPFLFLAPLIQFFAQANPRRLLIWSANGGVAGVILLAIFWSFNRVYFAARFEALSGNPNIFGYVCSAVFVLLCVGLASANGHRSRISFLIAASVCLAFVFASGSRAALIAVILTIGIMGAICLPWRSIWVRAAFVALACSTVLVLTGLSNVGERSTVFSRKVLQFGFDISQFDPNRDAIWRCGWEIVWQAPVLGEGHGKAISELSACIKTKTGKALVFSHFHNVLLDQFAKFGLIGLAASAFLLVMPLLLLRRWLSTGAAGARTPFGLALTAGILSFWFTHFVTAMVNIGFGHDAVDGLFIYTNSMLFGIAHAYQSEKVQLRPVYTDDHKAGAEANALGNRDNRIPQMKPDLKLQIGQFGVGMALGAALLGVVVIFLGYTTGLNRLTVAFGGYAVSAKDTALARDATIELRAFVDRFKVELLKPDSGIHLPNTQQFHSASSVWKAEFDKLSIVARGAQAISVRKDGEDYKILLSGPVCPIAVSTGMFSPDPRRPSQYATLCNYFADWGGNGGSF